MPTTPCNEGLQKEGALVRELNAAIQETLKLKEKIEGQAMVIRGLTDEKAQVLTQLDKTRKELESAQKQLIEMSKYL